MSTPDEFYIGYEPTVPPRVARRVRVTVCLAAAVLISAAVLVTLAQRPLAESSFEFGQQRTWTGWLVHAPAPALLVPTPHGVGRFWLVGLGKHGASGALAGLADGWVHITGSQITRDPWRMIEVHVAVAAPTPPLTDAPALDDSLPGQEITVRGEIVDSKCFLGVMNPGERTVHRDCAIRCLSGGVPPMLSFANDAGHVDLAVLVDAQGRLLHDDVHDLVGRAVTARGRLAQVNGQPVFQLASLTGVGR